MVKKSLNEHRFKGLTEENFKNMTEVQYYYFSYKGLSFLSFE